MQASGTVPIGRENCQRDGQTIPPTSLGQVSRGQLYRDSSIEEQEPTADDSCAHSILTLPDCCLSNRDLGQARRLVDFYSDQQCVNAYLCTTLGNSRGHLPIFLVLGDCFCRG